MFQKRGLHWLQMRPWTRSLHWQSSPLGTDPQPANASTTPAGSQLQSVGLNGIATGTRLKIELELTFASRIVVETLATAIAALSVKVTAALAPTLVVARHAQ